MALVERGMARSRRALLLGLIPLLLTAACGAPAQKAAGGTNQAATTPRAPTVLRYVSRFEPPTLAAKLPVGGGTSDFLRRPFNAGLVVLDGQRQPRPVLAEQLPQLGSDSWRVTPDGAMETTYRLRPGLTWHDGEPLTAEDFAFAYRVYRTKSLPFLATPQDQMDGVTAPDARTVVIHWNSPYVGAGALDSADFDPLPAHILRESFQAVDQDAASAESFSNLPFWSQEYVGAGPYQLDRLEPGAYIQGVAFAGYALGRPKIDRVVLRAVGDGNRVLTDLLAGEVDWAPRLTLRFEHLPVLKQDFIPSGRGTYETGPTFFIMVQHQFRPEFENEPALYDPRVRKAIAHTVDKQALLDGLFAAESEIPEAFALRSAAYYSEVDRTATKFPYDVRRTEQLMGEAGLARDRDGFYSYASGQRFRPDFLVRAGSELERAQAIMVDTWRQAGIEVGTTVQPDIALPLIERSNFKNLQAQTHTFEKFNYWTTPEIGTAANGWRGDDRSGWSSPAFDQLYDTLRRTLDRAEMDRVTVQIVKMLSEELPGYPVYVPPALTAKTAALQGPEFGAMGSFATTFAWNIEQWDYTR